MKLIDIITCCDRYDEDKERKIIDCTCPDNYRELLALGIEDKIYIDNGICRFGNCDECWNAHIEDLEEESEEWL